MINLLNKFAKGKATIELQKLAFQLAFQLGIGWNPGGEECEVKKYNIVLVGDYGDGLELAHSLISNLEDDDYTEMTMDDIQAQLDTSVEWDGEGLPPVGYRCVVTPHNSMWGFGSVDDRTGVVLMYKAESFVFAIDTPDVCVHGADVVVSRTDKADFSKLLNKEELAAKARECELHEIADFMKNDKSPSDAEAIYNYVTFKNYRNK
jgi:hypothetical protein